MKNSATTSTEKNTSEKKTKAKPAAPSFAKALFHGDIQSNHLFPFPEPKKEEADILQMCVDSIQKITRELGAADFEVEKKIPDAWMSKFKEMGLFGLIIPEEYGGFGVTTATYIQILSTLAIVDSSLTISIGAHQSIGLKALLMFGNPEQKKKYLPKLATGEMIAAFGLTEPGAGSDARSLKTSAELSKDKTHYVLNGEKIWITNGGFASFFTVFARTNHPNEPEGKRDKITCFIVTRDMAGFSSGPEEKKMGLFASSTTSLHFDNVKVPVENVIGEAGAGFKVAMEVLNNGRLGLGGACSIVTKKLAQMAIDHAMQRKQFGQPLSSFGIIQSKIANMAIDNFAGESMVRMTADMMHRGNYDYSLESAMCKVFCTEMEWRAVNEALQIAGGNGYMKEYGYEKILRDSRIFMIWEGANEILRLFVGLGGMQGPGDDLKQVSQALKEPMNDLLRSIGVLTDFGVRWVQRRVTTPGKITGYHEQFQGEAETFEKYTAMFAAETERVLLKRGKKIVQDQFAVKRVADCAIDLYAIACTISHGSKILEQRGLERSDLEAKMVKAFVRKARRRIAENLRRLAKNDDNLEASIANTLYERGGFPVQGVFTLP